MFTESVGCFKPGIASWPARKPPGPLCLQRIAPLRVGMSYFQELLAWRFAGATLWSLAISVSVELVLATLLSMLSLPGALGMIGLRGLLLLGLQFLVLVRGLAFFLSHASAPLRACRQAIPSHA